jgi:hypothetical protein
MQPAKKTKQLWVTPKSFWISLLKDGPLSVNQIKVDAEDAGQA